MASSDARGGVDEYRSGPTSAATSGELESTPDRADQPGTSCRRCARRPFSVELGIDVDRDADEIEKWALAATLIGSSPVPVAVRAYRVLEQAGIDTFADVQGCDREPFICLLDQGGFTRHDESTALRLRALAEVVEHTYGEGLAALGAEIASTAELERKLGTLPGWDEAIVGTFLRELRGCGRVARSRSIRARPRQRATWVCRPPFTDSQRSPRIRTSTSAISKQASFASPSCTTRSTARAARSAPGRGRPRAVRPLRDPPGPFPVGSAGTRESRRSCRPRSVCR